MSLHWYSRGYLLMPILWVLLSPHDTTGTGPIDRGMDVEVFVRLGCPHCEAAKVFLKQLENERPELRIITHDVGEDQRALQRLENLAEERRISRLGVPAFFLRGELIIGYGGEESTGRRIRELLLTEAEAPSACGFGFTEPCEPAPVTANPRDAVEAPFFGRISATDLGLPLFTIAIGLLDGFNPCAMWVLLFLLALLVNLKSRRKMTLIAGTFVAVSGLVYFAFMAAWLNVFLLIGFSRTTQVVLGGIALAIGAVNVKDFAAYRKGLSLAIPEAAKPTMYSRLRRVLDADNLTGALLSIIGLALFVNVIELLCTAGFPALYTQVLTLHDLPVWQYYGYLALYNLAYVLDDGLMVTLAVVTLGRRKLQEREGRWLKLVSGLVMLGLGLVLLARPQWLI